MISRRYAMHVAVGTVVLIYGFQLLRACMPPFCWWFANEVVGRPMAAVCALALCLLGLLAPQWRRLLGRWSLFVGATVVVAARVAVQVAHSAAHDLLFGAVGLVVFLWFVADWLIEAAPHAELGRPHALAIAFPMAMSVETAARMFLQGCDIAWLRGPLWIVALAVVGLAAIAAAVVEAQSPGRVAGSSGSPVAAWLAAMAWWYLWWSFVLYPGTEGVGHASFDGLGSAGQFAMPLVALPWCAVWAHEWKGSGRRLLAACSVLLGCVALGGVGVLVWHGPMLVSVIGTYALASVFAGLRADGTRQPSAASTAAVAVASVVGVLALGAVSAVADSGLTLLLPALVLGALAVSSRPEAKRRGAPERWVNAYIWLTMGTALFAIVALPTAPPSPQESNAEPAKAVRVLTYNIHQGISADMNADIDGIVATIYSQRPDIVVLNEVRRGGAESGFCDMLPRTAWGLGMRYAYGAVRRDGQLGNAILARRSLYDAVCRPFGQYWRYPRSALTAWPSGNETELRVTATHLDAYGSREVREAQAGELARVWGGRRNTIIAGDLNDVPDSRTVRTLLDAGLVDVAAEVGDAEGSTFWPSEEPLRIDYILASPDLLPLRAWVVPSRASDHMPVVAEFDSRPEWLREREKDDGE